MISVWLPSRLGRDGVGRGETGRAGSTLAPLAELPPGAAAGRAGVGLRWTVAPAAAVLAAGIGVLLSSAAPFPVSAGLVAGPALAATAVAGPAPAALAGAGAFAVAGAAAFAAAAAAGTFFARRRDRLPLDALRGDRLRAAAGLGFRRALGSAPRPVAEPLDVARLREVEGRKHREPHDGREARVRPDLLDQMHVRKTLAA